MHWVLTLYLAAEEKFEGNHEVVLTEIFEAWTKSWGAEIGWLHRASTWQRSHGRCVRKPYKHLTFFFFSKKKK